MSPLYPLFLSRHRFVHQIFRSGLILCASAMLMLSINHSQAQTLLRVQGSNTLGADLMPALAESLLHNKGLYNIEQRVLNENETLVQGYNAKGEAFTIEIKAHGTSTGFAALQDGSADLAAASRPIKDTERQALLAVGDFASPQAEKVVALDGLAVIVHPSNPITQLSLAQLAAIFAGEIGNWQELGGESRAITLYSRDHKSGTFETFKELVLAPTRQLLAARAQHFESSRELSSKVSQDLGGIGFIALPYVLNAKALRIASGDTQALPANAQLIGAEDYPLARRLYLYLPPKNSHPWATELVELALSPAGQDLMQQHHFIGQSVQTMHSELQTEMPPTYQELVRHAQRLNLNFRFQEGSATLDNKALYDLQRLSRYLHQHHKTQGKLVLVGFDDPRATPERSMLLSKWRVIEVRRALAELGIETATTLALGDALPVGNNQHEQGRRKNRRVEVWLY